MDSDRAANERDPATGIWLREVIESDLDHFFEHQREAEGRYMAAFTPKDPEDREGYVAHWHRLLANPLIIKRSILVDGQVAGHVVHFDQFGEKEVGYWLGQAYWGQGIATQALRLFLEEVRARPLVGRAAKDNLASIRVLQKCGFRLCGEDTGFSFARGQDVAEVILRLDARVGEIVLETSRLRLSKLESGDADFILRLLNEPTFIENIGDRGVRTIEDAGAYILNGPIASYTRFGFGLYLVESQATGETMGLCGLLKRDVLDDVDIGYAFLPAFCGHGYAREAATAVLHHAHQVLGLNRVVAIVNPQNQPSIRLLEKLGFRYEKMVRLTAVAPEIKLFAWGD